MHTLRLKQALKSPVLEIGMRGSEGVLPPVYPFNRR